VITGIGTDVVEIIRFRKHLDKPELLQHVFTRTEIDNAPSGLSQDTFFATLFAVKEAILKALGCGLTTGSLWQEIQITRDWKAHLSGSLGLIAEMQSVARIHISQSRVGEKAIAFVLIETVTEDGIA
jgi:holo-[acyl-carrier protein] synthase